MKGKLGILVALCLLLVIPLALGAVVTPTCTFGGSTPGAGSSAENTTLHVTITPVTGYNMTNATIAISPHNGTAAGVFINDPNATSYTAIWTNLPEQVYTLTASMALLNNTADNDWQNFSAITVSCTSRQFTLKEEDAALSPQQIEEITKTKGVGGFDTTTGIIVGAIVVVIIIAAAKKK